MAIRYGWLLVAATLAAIASHGRAQTKPGAGFDALVAMEREDLGVPPSKQLHAGPLHGPTPASLPGGQVITIRIAFPAKKFYHLPPVKKTLAVRQS